MKKNVLFLTLSLVASSLPGQSIDWTMVTPTGLPDNSLIFSPMLTARHDTAYMAVNGKLYYTYDGETWEEPPVQNRYLQSGGNYASGPTSWYAFGGHALHEVDGSWTTGSIPNLFNYVITRLGERMVAVGDGGQSSFLNPPVIVYSDDDGATWSEPITFEPEADDANINAAFKDVIEVDGTLYAVGMPNVIQTSTDGANWSEIRLSEDTAKPFWFGDIEYRDGVFVAAGQQIWTSTDGANWTNSGVVNDSRSLFSDIAYDGNRWLVLASDFGVAQSADGVNWQLNNYRRRATELPAALGHHLMSNQLYAEIAQGTSMGDVLGLTRSGVVAAAMEDRFVVFQGNTGVFVGTRAASFLDAAESPDGVNFNLPWFGWFTQGERGWLYHYNLGWTFVQGQDSRALWMFNERLGWIFSGEGLFPYFFHRDTDTWGYYADFGEWFYNVTLAQWQTVDVFGQESWVVSADWLVGKTITITDRLGTHKLRVIGDNLAEATVNTPDGVISITAQDSTTWFDSSFAAALLEGRRFTFDMADATSPGIGNRALVILTFDDENGGSTQITYTILNGLIPSAQTNVMGTFTVN